MEQANNVPLEVGQELSIEGAYTKSVSAFTDNRGRCCYSYVFAAEDGRTYQHFAYSPIARQGRTYDLQARVKKFREWQGERRAILGNLQVTRKRD